MQSNHLRYFVENHIMFNCSTWNLDRITLDGDQVSRRGALTGGYYEKTVEFESLVKTLKLTNSCLHRCKKIYQKFPDPDSRARHFHLILTRNLKGQRIRGDEKDKLNESYIQHHKNLHQPPQP